MDADNSTLDAIWCWNSETSEEVLIERATGKIIAIRHNDRIINPEIQREKPL